LKMDKVLQLLSLCQRAGKIASGEFSTEEAIKGGKAYLTIVAGDSSENTIKHFKDMCSYRDIPFMLYSDKETLGHCIGKEFRASLTVNDKGLADKILSECNGTEVV